MSTSWDLKFYELYHNSQEINLQLVCSPWRVMLRYRTPMSLKMSTIGGIKDVLIIGNTPRGLPQGVLS